MRVAVHLNIQNWRPDVTDAEAYRAELALAEQAEEMGFDAIWCVEHHFDDYSIVPDNIQVLSYLAAKTERIALGTGAVILPWHDPVRVAERLIVLDTISQGRLLVGFGRGLAMMEYEGFGVDMNEARDRFDESVAMVIDALETGFIEGSGPYFPQAKVELRPRAERSFSDRIYSVAMSPDSLWASANLGATMMAFVTEDIAIQADGIATWRAQYRETAGREPQPPILTDHTFCHRDPEFAEQVARQSCEAYYASVISHYGYDGDHFDDIRSFQSYADNAKIIQERGLEQSAREFTDAQIWGTPEQIIEKYRKRAEVLGEFGANIVFSYGCMPFDLAEQSQRLFAEEVLPVLREL